MKKMILFLFIVVSTNGFSQQTTTPALAKADYLKKSKSQKTTGWILVGVGATCIAIAAPGNVSFDVLPVLVIGGGAAVVGGILSFLSAGKNKRKADNMSASFKMETQSSVQQYSIIRTPYPTIAFRVGL